MSVGALRLRAARLIRRCAHGGKRALELSVQVGHHPHMDDWLGSLPGIVRPLRYREFWVTRNGGLLQAFVFGGTAVLAAFAFELDRRLEIAAFPCVFVACFLAWWILRGVYWRTGRRKKIGIAYDGHRVPMEDWARTREELARLVEESKLDHHVSLRLLPRRLVETDERSKKTRQKYGFTIILRVEVSPTLDDQSATGANRIKISLQGEYARGVQEQFVPAVAQLHAELLRGPAPKDVLGVLKHRAATIFEQIVLWLGVTEFVAENYAVASNFLTVLENRLEGSCKANEKPRLSVRWLDCLALLAPSRFGGATPPGPDVLPAAVLAARKAGRRYGTQFPEVHLLLGRDLFYQNELDEALDHTNRALAFPLRPNLKVSAVLNVAVLNLLLDRPERSADAFEELRESGELHRLDWIDLTGFADFARELGHGNAVFLQALYRRFVDSTKVDGDFDDSARAWLGQDASRNRLLRFLESAKTVKAPNAGQKKEKARQKGAISSSSTKAARRGNKRRKRRKR